MKSKIGKILDIDYTDVFSEKYVIFKNSIYVITKKYKNTDTLLITLNLVVSLRTSPDVYNCTISFIDMSAASASVACK